MPEYNAKKEDANWNPLFKKRQNKSGTNKLKPFIFQNQCIKNTEIRSLVNVSLGTTPCFQKTQYEEVKKNNWLWAFIVNNNFWLYTTSTTLCKKHAHNLLYHCRNSTNQLKLLLPSTYTRSKLLVCLHPSQETPIFKTRTTFIERRIIGSIKLFFLNLEFR